MDTSAVYMHFVFRGCRPDDTCSCIRTMCVIIILLSCPQARPVDFTRPETMHPRRLVPWFTFRFHVLYIHTLKWYDNMYVHDICAFVIRARMDFKYIVYVLYLLFSISRLRSIRARWREVIEGQYKIIPNRFYASLKIKCTFW